MSGNSRPLSEAERSHNFSQSDAAVFPRGPVRLPKLPFVHNGAHGTVYANDIFVGQHAEDGMGPTAESPALNGCGQ